MLIRYPGSKDKHLGLLEPYLVRAERSRSVVEPFAGTAAITFHLLKQKMVDRYLINDIDPGMIDLWQQVRDDPERLIRAIDAYTPNVDDFYTFKADGGSEPFERAFRKLVLHQVSFSGLGARAGGPLGGREQKSQYGVDCRWYPTRLAKNIRTCSQLLNSADGRFTNDSWEQAIDTGVAEGSFIYLDPPYYLQGPVLYLTGTIDHDLLAEKLHGYDDWVLSYDDVPEVRDLYAWANVQRLDVRSHLHHKIIGDVVITPSAK